MSKEKSAKEKSQRPQAAAPFHNPFAALQSLRTQLPEGNTSDEAVIARTPEDKPSERRAVVRYERKGHGGKEMTRITHFAPSADEATALTQKLKQKLGCGGHSEGADILLQGDQRERLKGPLASLGATRITIG